ncbi:MAG: response regulator, partial [Thalassolituus sp.]
LLRSWGAEVSAHTSTLAALDDIVSKRFLPELLIADYRMPGRYNGSEFISEARKHMIGIPGLIVTGDTSDEVVGVFRAQQLDYVHKPIKPAQLRMMIQRILTRNVGEL